MASPYDTIPGIAADIANIGSLNRNLGSYSGMMSGMSLSEAQFVALENFLNSL